MCEIRKMPCRKKQFQQNMKDKVRVFEDGGIRLLKRGQKGVVHAIFSRFGLVLVLLLLQAFALFQPVAVVRRAAAALFWRHPCW